MTRDRLGGVALAAVLGLLALIGAYRIGPVDVPWHLQTGRLALSSGALPVTNTFSWTFPDHPLTQQYPLFQVPLALLVDHLGFEAFGLWNLALWWLAGLAWMLAAGSLRDAARQPLLWLVVVLGIQRHHVPRPEVWTLLGGGLILWGLDRWARTRRAGPLAAVVLAQWLMVNGHQLWLLGLAFQASFLIHLGASRSLSRWGADPTDAGLPLGPPALALLGSLAALPLSPLGLEVYATPLGVIGTVLTQGAATRGGAHARELMPVWTDPLALVLYGVDLLFLGWAGWRSRRSWSLHEALVAASGLAMATLALRGISFCTVAAGWALARVGRRLGPSLPEESPVHLAASAVAIAIAALLAAGLLSSEAAYLHHQPGMGRSRGEWADPTVAFLATDPPPGRLMNLTWVSGNQLVGLYPQHALFVDPRFESYPREFLLETIEAAEDRATFDRLVDRWQPTMLVAEMRVPALQRRVADLVSTGGWALVHLDSALCVAVRRTPETEAWLARREVDLDALRVEDWVDPADRVLLAQQQIRVARLWLAFQRPDLAAPLVDAARNHADHPSVASDLATLPPPPG